MKFRKKPVVIDAEQFLGSRESADKILRWANSKDIEMRYTSIGNIQCILVIQSLEGEHRALPQDWIIKGVKGEFYPCKPDIFQMTYDPAD